MRVLLVEDDPDLATALHSSLTRDAHVVTVATDGIQALERASEFDFDVIVLDRDLPRLSGDAVCQELKRSGTVIPVLMLTALSTVADRVAGLNMGADDYLTKPFAYDELVARIHAVTRRNQTAQMESLRHGDLVMDLERRTVDFKGQRIRLSPKEQGVLESLLRADGRPLSVDQLLDRAWEQPDSMSRSVVKVTVHSLRRKLDPGLIAYDAGFG